jgi:hypothetical protein
MNDQLTRELLHEVADDVEPGDRLDAIRAATASPRRGARRTWWVAGAVGLVAASVVTALALTSGDAPRTQGSDLAGAPSPSATASADGTGGGPVAVYFVGDTAGGPRLFREFRPTDQPDGGVLYAIHAALRGDALDPDYRSAWPAGIRLRQWIPKPDVITVILDDAPVERPAGMSEEDADLALEQLVRTAQALYGNGKVPVDVQLEQQVTDTILGVPTTAPLTGAPDADVLAPVSLSDPNERQVVHADDYIDITGRAMSDDGMISLQLKRREGGAVIDAGTYTLYGTGDHPDLQSVQGALAPFSISFASEEIQSGEYDLIASVKNADGTVDRDTRRITVVD